MRVPRARDGNREGEKEERRGRGGSCLAADLCGLGFEEERQ